MATAEDKTLPQEASTRTITAAMEMEGSGGKENSTNSGLVISNTVALGDDPATTSENGAGNSESGSGSGDPASTPEKGAELIVTVCATTEAGDEVCVTVSGEGREMGEGREARERGEGRERSGSLPNGKLSSTAFQRHHRHTLSFSSTHSGRLSPYGSDGHSSSSDVASLSQDTSFSLDLQLLVEQLKNDLLSKLGVTDRTEEKKREGEDLTKTLLEHVVTLKMELATVKEENERLKNVRSNMDNEIHELTENLFEEAYKMVDEAKGGKVSAEKRLADAAGKIDAMETEMSTLKRIIQTSQHQPQIRSSSSSSTTGAASSKTLSLPRSGISPSQKHIKRSSIRRAVHKIQKRTAGLGAPKSPGVSSSRVTPLQPLMLLEHKGGVKGDCFVTGEIDQEEYAQFHRWIKSLSLTSPLSPPSPTTPTPTTSSSSPHAYLTTIIDQDVRPCLSFKNTELSERVLQAVQDNSVTMEALHTVTNSNGHPGHTRSSSLPPEGVLCALSEARERDCTHRMKLGDMKEWLYISQSCRDRVAAVCDFFMHIGHIQKGIIKADTTKLYWQVAKLRGLMQLSRFSLSLPPDLPPTP